MPRLFVGNFDFEHELAEGGLRCTQVRERLNGELACSWLAVARDGDAIWTPQVINERAWRTLFERFQVDVGMVTGPVRGGPMREVASRRGWLAGGDGWEIVPWGWSGSIVKEWGAAEGAGPPLEVVRWANSREFSCELEAQLGVSLPGAGVVRSMEELQQRLRQINRPWILKANFGMSGREQLRGSGELTLPQVGWCKNRLKRDGLVVFEPRLEVVREVGLQFEIERSGEVRLLGGCELLVDQRGEYLGSGCGQFDLSTEGWLKGASLAELACERLASKGYFGPVGIDQMEYRVQGGGTAIRAIQDINARWTMGRLALEWGKRFPERHRLRWRHGSFGERSRGDVGEVDVHLRVEFTSPEEVGGQECRHQSWLESSEP